MKLRTQVSFALPMRAWRARGAALWAVVCLLQWSVQASEGNELIGFGALMKARGGAGAASALDGTWAILNPAGLAGLERRADLSLELLYNRVGGAPAGFPLLSNPGAGNMADHNLVPIPSFSLVWPGGEGGQSGWTFGTGIIGVQGNVVDFPHSRTTLGALMGHADRRAALEIAKVPFTAAKRFDNGWAAGISVVGVYSRFRMDSLTLRLRPTRGGFEWDTAFGVGLQFGLQRDWDRFSVGASVATPHWMQPYSKYDDIILWNLDLPLKAQAGVAWRPSRRLELVLDYKYIAWSRVKQLGSPTVRSGLSWRDQHVVKGGASYGVDERWTVRGGFSYGRSAIPPEASFANILTPAAGEKHLTLALSRALSDGADLHFAYTRTFPNEQTDNGRGDFFSVLGRGSRISYEEHSLTVQFTRKF